MTKRTDVLVIGGGIIGVACAYFLAKEGNSIRLIEQKRIGNGASSGNLGLLTPSYALPLNAPGMTLQALKWMLHEDSPVYIKPRFDLPLLHWLLRFAVGCTRQRMLSIGKIRAGILTDSDMLLEKIIRKEKIQCEWQSEAVFKIFRTETAIRAYEETNAILREFGLAGTLLSGRELAGKEPALREDLAGAYVHSCDSRLNPAKLLAGWNRVNKRLGVTVEEDCEVTRFEISGDTIEGVVTSLGRWSAKRYVLATGAWSSLFQRQLHVRIPVQPGKGYTITMKRPSVCPRHAMIFKERNAAVTPFEKSYRLGGTLEFSGHNMAVNRVRVEAILRAAREYLKEPEAEKIEGPWVGWRPMTFDELPIIGRSPFHKNFILATGHGMMGVGMSAATGKIVAALVADREPHLDVRPFRPERFL